MPEHKMLQTAAIQRQPVSQRQGKVLNDNRPQILQLAQLNVIQRASKVNGHDLTNANIAFANSFYNWHWATNEQHAKHYSLERMKQGFRGQNNTVIKGNLNQIKGYIRNADITLNGEKDNYKTFTVKVPHWFVQTLVGADENRIGECHLYDSNVTFKGYLKEAGDEVKKLLVTGIAG